MRDIKLEKGSIRAMKVYWKTDVGSVRVCNQDAVDGGLFADESAWAVVCDGMGGANGGDFASGEAIKAIKERMLAGYMPHMSEQAIQQLMKNAINTANMQIYSKAQLDSELNGMGTTVVLALVCAGCVYTAHAGDSRAYKLSGKGIETLTHDHSVVQDMVDRGELSELEARRHPKKNIITRALGVNSYIDIDFNKNEYNTGDMILLCTDGLTNHVSAEEIGEMYLSLKEQELCAALVEEANINGGRDNITVALIC